MLGWKDKAWGYHGDNGYIYSDRPDFGDPFGPEFGDEDTIGCGVNFKEGIAFYTRNGEVIGKSSYLLYSKCHFRSYFLHMDFRSPFAVGRLLITSEPGRAFQDIKGKLYPAVSANLSLVGCVMTAKFWNKRGKGNEDFVYKGSLTDEKTLKESELSHREADEIRRKTVDTSSDDDVSDVSTDVDMADGS